MTDKNKTQPKEYTQKEAEELGAFEDETAQEAAEGKPLPTTTL